MTTLQGKTAQGVLWSAISQWGRLGLTLLTTIILARLLPPEDFGLLAMCTVFTGLFGSVGDLGLGSAIVQTESPSADDMNSAFWSSAALGLIACVVVAGAAPAIASFYREDGLTPILRWLGVGLAASSLAVVHQATLTRTMDFRRIAVVELAASALGGGLGIASALNGAGVYSLVIQSVATATCSTGGYWIVATWKPTVRFAGFRQGGLLKFGTHLVGFNAVNYAARNVDYLLIGRFLGAEQLGYYSLAYRLMMFPLQNVSAILGKVVFPAFSSIQRDDTRIREAFIRLTRYVALLTFPLMLGVLVTAREVIEVVFGSRWEPAVPLVRILALVGLLQSIGTNTGTLFMAKGRTDLLFRWGLFATAVIIAGISLGLLGGGIQDVAFGYAAANLLLFVPGIAIPFRLVGGRIWNLFRALLPVFGMSAAAAACVVACRFLQDAFISPAESVALSISASVMIGVYAVLVWQFMGGTLAELRDLLKSAFATIV